MAGPTYSPARIVAQRLQAFFATNAAEYGEADASLPEAAAVEAVIGAAFWASLRREEGREPRISLVLLPPERTTGRCCSTPACPRPRGPRPVAPAVERPGIHLGVWRFDGELRVWGMTRRCPRLSFVLEVVAPGLLVVKTPARPPLHQVRERRGARGLRGQVRGPPRGGRPRCAARAAPASRRSTCRPAWRSRTTCSCSSPSPCARTAKGGIVLVVPDGDDAWRASVVQPINYVVRAPPLRRSRPFWSGRTIRRAELRAAVDALAGLTAVDGATVIDHGFRLLAFGAKIARRQGGKPLERVLLSEPIEGS